MKEDLNDEEHLTRNHNIEIDVIVGGFEPLPQLVPWYKRVVRDARGAWRNRNGKITQAAGSEKHSPR